MEHPPQEQRRQRGLSFHSNKSRDPPAPKSPKSPKHERKYSEHFDPNSKADPNNAMNEQQPSTSLVCIECVPDDY